MSMLTTIKAHKGKTAAIGGGAVAAIIAIAVGLTHFSPVSWGMFRPFDTSSGLAIQGYDPVAYHVSGAATKGSAAHALEWAGATWRFASAENRSRFEADPEAFAPQFGGHCAQAISAGFTFSPDPKVFHVEDGRLYLFLTEGVREEWVSQIPQGGLEHTKRNWSGS